MREAVHIEEVGSHMQGEAGLARTSGTDEGEQAGIVEEPLDLLHLSFAPDEAGQVDREIVWKSIERLERRELRGEAGSGQLENTLGPLQVFEAALTHIGEGGSRWQVVSHKLLCGCRQEGLSTIPSGEEASHAVQGGAEVIAIPLLGGAGVQSRSHPHTKFTKLTPILGLESALGLKGGSESLRCGREGDTESITYRLEDIALVGLYSFFQNGVVPVQSRLHGRGVLLPQPCATLYIGEQEGNRAAGGESTVQDGNANLLFR
jgi:hypothetical protein